MASRMKQQSLEMAADENKRYAQYEQYRRPTKRVLFLSTVQQTLSRSELGKPQTTRQKRIGMPMATATSLAAVGLWRSRAALKLLPG